MRAYITMRDAPAKHRDQDRESGQYVIASALRTLQVLRAFAEPPHRLGLADLVATLGMERNQAYRSLKTLEAGEFLEAVGNSQFQLGPAATELGFAASRSEGFSLVEAASPFLDELSRETRETVHLFMRAGERAVCVDRRESTQSVRLVSVLGRSVPLHAGAVPKAILAFLPAAEREQVLARLTELPHYTERTELQPARLRRQLDEIIEVGYSISDEDFDPSARGVGAPIFAEEGEVVGGISLGGPSFRVNDDLLAHFAQLVRSAAEKISRRLALSGRK